MNYRYSVVMIVIIAVVTMFLRFLPFLIFNGTRKTPEIITYLGRVLPFAIIGMLVVYCFKSVSITAFPFGLSEFIAGLSVVILHLWKKNTLLSVGIGTVLYMLLVQFVFV